MIREAGGLAAGERWQAGVDAETVVDDLGEVVVNKPGQGANEWRVAAGAGAEAGLEGEDGAGLPRRADGGRHSSWPQHGPEARLAPFLAKPCPNGRWPMSRTFGKGSAPRTTAALRWSRPGTSDGLPARRPAS